MTLKIGDKRKSKNWGEVVIVGLSKENVTVEFVNTGNRVEIRKGSLPKGSFVDTQERERMMGRKSRPKGSWQIGEICSSQNWGDFKVVEINGDRLLIEFLLTGNQKDVRSSQAAKGGVRDLESLAAGGRMLNYESPQRAAAKIPSGTIYKSNYWGDTEVLEYNSSTDVKIRFIESGNVYTVQKDALEKGLVKDTTRQTDETASKEAKRKADADLVRKLQEHARHIKNINLKNQKAHRQHVKDLRQQSIEAAKHAEMTAVRNHERYGDYQIVCYANQRCIIRFLTTGYETETTICAAKSGFVRDFKQFSKEDEKEHYRRINAENYLANREVRLKQASDWQKANPEKARVRNRNRRAKRINAEGTHTEAQTTALLEVQDHRCNSCGACLVTNEKHLDHIMPLDLGGSNWIDNLQWLCQFCNNSKSNKHPDEWAAEILTEAWQARREQRRLMDAKY